MRAGFIAAAHGSSGRHLRFVALATALVAITISLWIRLALSTRGQMEIGDMAFAATVATAAIAGMLSLWRNPLSHSTRMMTTPALRQQLATHHAGHLVAAYVDNPDRVKAANLSEPCGRHTPEAPMITQSALHADLVIGLAGMAAEEIFAGESGTHVDRDLARATAIGADMVGRFGMAGSTVSLATPRHQRSSFVERVLDDHRTRKELESILRESKRESVRLMLENRHAIIAVRDALMRSNRLTAAQINEIISGAEKTRYRDDAVLVDLRVVGDRPRSVANAKL